MWQYALWSRTWDWDGTPGDAKFKWIAIDAGADAVLCHHPHIVRGVDYYQGRPIFHGLGLNISVFSVDKSINVGLLGCTELVPDIDKLAHSFEDELAKLVDTCD